MKHRLLVLASLFLLTAAAAQAGPVINWSDVGGLRTFKDTGTGRVWLDMDNFFNAAATSGTTGFAMIAAAQGAGFTFATYSDVYELLNSLPLGGGQWASYAAVMGYGHPRQLIWGMYDDGNGNPYGYAWAYSNETSWSYNGNATDANFVQNGNSPGSMDMGLWAYQTGTASVPDPGSSLLLLGMGLVGLKVWRKRS